MKQPNFTRPPTWILIFGVVMLAVAMWQMFLSEDSQEPAPADRKALCARCDRATFSSVLELVRRQPATIERLTFLKDAGVSPGWVQVTRRGNARDLLAVIPGEVDYTMLSSEADRQNVSKDAKLVASGTDTDSNARVQGPSSSGREPAVGLVSVIFTILPLAIMLFIAYMAWKSFQFMNQGGAAAFARSKMKRFQPEAGPRVTFADVAGVEEAKEEMEIIVEFLKDPSEFVNLGGEMPKGVLMVGPPGTGKTLLAKAVAGEANRPFFYISASDFVEMFVGVGAARVRDMFEEVRKHLPCILFIDELDGAFQIRGAGIGGGNDERQQTLNQILVEMDGFNNNQGLVVIGATNRPDVLDPAILRPGRFGDKKITITLPDLAGRHDILKVHARNLKLDSSVDLLDVARRTAGFSGADLKALLKVNATGAAVKRHKALGKRPATVVTLADIDAGISEMQMGGDSKSKSRRLSDEKKRLIAYHELGHAVVAEALYQVSAGWEERWGEPVRKITIIGAGAAGGYTLAAGDEDPFCYTREQLLGQITMSLAGNRSEALFLKTTSTGAASDFERAYETAKKMVTQWGMSALGPIFIGKENASPFLGKALATSEGYGLGVESSNQIDHEIKKILDDCGERAASILRQEEGFVHYVVPILIEKETLLRDEWLALWHEYHKTLS